MYGCPPRAEEVKVVLRQRLFVEVFMMRQFALCVTLAFAMVSVLAVCYIPAAAQTITVAPAAISGSVNSERGPVGGAAVTVSGPVLRTAITRADGTFSLTDLAPGIYTIVVKAAGYQAASRENVVVTEGETVVNVALSGVQTSGGLKEIAKVTTVARSGNFNITPASVDVISSQTLTERDTPRVRQELETIPGVSLSRSSLYTGNTSTVFDNVVFAAVRGGQPFETGTLVDGHPMYGAASNAGFSIGWIPPEFLQRVDVVKGPGATTPSISNAINGSVNFVTLDPSRTATGGMFSIETDGFGGSIERLRYVNRLTSKLSAAVGYQLWDSPGPSNGSQEYFLVGKNNTNLINGQPFANCVGTNCQFTLSPNAGAYYQNFILAPYVIQGLGCCTTDQTAFTSRSPLIKLRYDFSPSFFVDAGYFGNQTFQQVPLTLGTYIFAPGAGYSGSVQPGVVTAVAGYGGGTTAPVSGTGYVSAMTLNAVGQLGNLTLSAKGIQVDQLQNFGNGLPFSGKNSTQAVSVPVTLYGTIASGATPAYTAYNGTAVQYAPGMGSYYYNYGSTLGGLTLQADLAAGNALYTLSYDKTQYGVTYNTNFGYTGTDIFSLNPYAGSYESVQSLMARGSFDLSRGLKAVATVYYDRYNAHASTDNNMTYQDHVSYYTAPRLGLTWRPDPNLSARLSAGASIAPAVLTNIIGSFGAIIPYPNANAPSAYQQTVANANVKPETSFGYDGGIDYRFGSTGVVVSADVYTTNLVNELFIATTQNGTINGLPFYVSKYQNIANARDEGVELSISRDVRRGLFWSLTGALMRAAPYNLGPSFYSSGVANYVANLGIINGANFTGLNNINGTSNYVSIPYSTGSMSLGWRGERNGFLRLDGNYYGANNQYYEPAFVLWSASTGLPVGMRGTLLTLSLSNITNIYPFTTPFQQNGSNGGISPVYVTNQLKAAISDGPGPRALRLGLTQRF